MALFCKKCAEKYGMRPDYPPILCEGCGKIINKKESILKQIINKLNYKIMKKLLLLSIIFFTFFSCSNDDGDNICPCMELPQKSLEILGVEEKQIFAEECFETMSVSTPEEVRVFKKLVKESAQRCGSNVTYTGNGTVDNCPKC